MQIYLHIHWEIFSVNSAWIKKVAFLSFPRGSWADMWQFLWWCFMCCPILVSYRFPRVTSFNALSSPLYHCDRCSRNIHLALFFKLQCTKSHGFDYKVVLLGFPNECSLAAVTLVCSLHQTILEQRFRKSRWLQGAIYICLYQLLRIGKKSNDCNCNEIKKTSNKDYATIYLLLFIYSFIKSLDKLRKFPPVALLCNHQADDDHTESDLPP